MSVKERLKKFIKSQGMTISGFEKIIGVSNGYVNSISKGIGGEVLLSVLEKTPNLNVEWLLTGKGNMLRTQEKTSIVNTATNGGSNVSIQGSENTRVGEQNSELLEIIKEQSKQLNEKDKQIEKLLNLLGK